MKAKKLQFVNLEQAKRLKSAGFDWNTPDYYYDVELDAAYYSAPTICLALKWFRDEKDFKTSINFFFNDCKTLYEIVWLSKEDEMDGRAGFEFYESAESALLDELLTIIEKRL